LQPLQRRRLDRQEAERTEAEKPHRLEAPCGKQEAVKSKM